MANMHVTEIGRQVPLPPIEAENNPVAEVSAMLLRGQAFTGATGVGLLVREEDCLVCRAATGSAVPDFGARVPVEGTFLGLCARSKKAERTEDADTDLRVERAAYGRVKPRSILAVPMRSGAEVIGVLAVFSTSAGAFNNTHVAILRTMSDSLTRIVPQLPSIPAAPAAVPTVADAPKKIASETAVSKAKPVAPAAAVTTMQKISIPEERVQKMPAAAEPEPPAHKADSGLLTLADDPGPRVALRTLPPLERPVIAAPRTVAHVQAPFFDLPRPSRRRQRMRNRMIAGAAVTIFATTLGYGAYAMRSQPEPGFSAAHPGVPAIFQEQASAIQATQARAANLPALTAERKETVSTTAKEFPAIVETAVPEPVRTPSVTQEVRPLARSTPAAEMEAPQLELATASAMPAISAPALTTPKAEVRQSQMTAAQLAQRVAPEYPMAALRTKAGGDVRLSAVIRKDGTVGEVKVISGNPLLRDSAVRAVKQWRYQPGTLDGHAIESTAEIVLRFAAPK